MAFKNSKTYGSGAVGFNVGCVKARKYLKGELCFCDAT